MTLSLSDFTTNDTNYVSKLNSNNAAIATAVDGKQDVSAKDAANGYAGLDSGGKVPIGEIPDLSSRYGAGPFYVPIFKKGVPSNSELLSKIALPGVVTFPASLTGSLGDVGTNPTATTTLTVGFYRGGTLQQSGTITISTSGGFGFAMSATFTTAAGDVLRVTNQASADATCADISVTLIGTR